MWKNCLLDTHSHVTTVFSQWKTSPKLVFPNPGPQGTSFFFIRPSQNTPAFDDYQASAELDEEINHLCLNLLTLEHKWSFHCHNSVTI